MALMWLWPSNMAARLLAVVAYQSELNYKRCYTDRKDYFTPGRLKSRDISEDVEYNEGGIGCSLKKLNYDLRKVKDEIKLRQQKHIEFEKEINQVSYMMQTGPTIETEPVL